ncbi:MAG: preprotein translocase subunit SecE [Flavobacteriales bacterium]
MVKIRTYIEEVYTELIEKVTWPTWSELQNSSFVVLISSAIVSLIVFLMDFIFGINSGPWKGILGWVYDIIKSLS